MTAMWGGGGPYDEWAAFLDRWAGGERLDPATLPPVSPDDFTGDAWERLVDRLTGALSRRLESWSDVLSRTLSEARDEFGAARALVHARWGIAAIRAMAGAAALPPDLARHLLDLVDGQVRSVQETLDRQVDRLRHSGVPRELVEARLRTIRDNPLTAAVAAERPTAPADGWYADPSVPARRRVIVGQPRTPKR